MKKLQFEYSMRIDYSEEINSCCFTIKCFPKDNCRQKISDVKILVSPPCNYSTGFDGLKNKQIYGALLIPHDSFVFKIKGNALTGLSEFDENEDEDISMIFRHPYGLNIPGKAINDFFDSLNLDEIKDDYSKALFIMESLFHYMIYKPESTDVLTTAEEAFEQGCGVCQDYTHIFIALMHKLNISARYVTGLITGEGASHAWAEILVDGKWYGFDPTNNKTVNDEHIKLGIGRDARDCLINRGLIKGSALQNQIINVVVEEVLE